MSETIPCKDSPSGYHTLVEVHRYTTVPSHSPCRRRYSWPSRPALQPPVLSREEYEALLKR